MDAEQTGDLTSRVFLRPLRVEDALTSCRWRNDPKVWEKTMDRPNLFVTEEIETEWARKVLSDPSRRSFAICLRPDGRYIGNAYLCDIDWIAGSVEFGLVIGERDTWGHGVGSVVPRLLIDESRKLGLKHIGVQIREDHAVSLHIHEKAGFTRDGLTDGIVHLRLEVE